MFKRREEVRAEADKCYCSKGSRWLSWKQATILDATETTGDAVRRPTCYTADKNTVACATTTLMADPILPWGAALADSAMAFISWYGMFHTGV